MTRELVGPAIHAVQFPCADVGVVGESVSPGDPKEVTLRAIKGIPPSQALFRPDYRDHQIYVPNGIETRIEGLPRKVRQLILHG